MHSLTSIKSDHHQFPRQKTIIIFVALKKPLTFFFVYMDCFKTEKNTCAQNSSESGALLMHESISESFLALKIFTQKRHINSLHKIRTFVLLSSLVLENFTDFILDFSLLSTLKHRQTNIKGPATEQEKNLKS